MAVATWPSPSCSFSVEIEIERCWPRGAAQRRAAGCWLAATCWLAAERTTRAGVYASDSAISVAIDEGTKN